MIRLLNKFIVGDFIHDSKRSRVGLILKSSTELELHIAWFNGTKSIVPLNPGTVKEAKLLRRVQRYKAIQIGDFSLKVGLPTRILKVLKSAELIAINTESLLVPQQQLDEQLLTKTLSDFCAIEATEHVEIVSKKSGDLLKSLIRFWL